MKNEIFKVTLCLLLLSLSPLWASEVIQISQPIDIIAESKTVENDLKIVLRITDKSTAMSTTEGFPYYQIDFKKSDGSFLSEKIKLEGTIYQSQLAKHVGWINDSLFYTYISGRANSYYSIYTFDKENETVYVRPLFSGCVHWNIFCKVEEGRFKLYIDDNKLLITYPPQLPK